MFARLTMFAVVALAIGSPTKAAPTTYGTYYDEEEVVANCTDSSCHSNFSQLPSDHLLSLKKINCLIYSSQPVVQVSVSISQTPGGPQFGRAVFVNPGPGVVSDNLYWYTFQTDAQILIGQGRYPFIEALTATTSSPFVMNCGILGDLVTPIK
jgi:hypothetical protein